MSTMDAFAHDLGGRAPLLAAPSPTFVDAMFFALREPASAVATTMAAVGSDNDDVPVYDLDELHALLPPSSGAGAGAGPSPVELPQTTPLGLSTPASTPATPTEVPPTPPAALSCRSAGAAGAGSGAAGAEDDGSAACARGQRGTKRGRPRKGSTYGLDRDLDQLLSSADADGTCANGRKRSRKVPPQGTPEWYAHRRQNNEAVQRCRQRKIDAHREASARAAELERVAAEAAARAHECEERSVALAAENAALREEVRVLKRVMLNFLTGDKA